MPFIEARCLSSHHKTTSHAKCDPTEITTKTFEKERRGEIKQQRKRRSGGGGGERRGEMEISSREARRKKIMERESDRLALITGRIQSLPASHSTSSQQPRHCHTASTPSFPFQDYITGNTIIPCWNWFGEEWVDTKSHHYAISLWMLRKCGRRQEFRIWILCVVSVSFGKINFGCCYRNWFGIEWVCTLLCPFWMLRKCGERRRINLEFEPCVLCSFISENKFWILLVELTCGTLICTHILLFGCWENYCENLMHYRLVYF